MESIRAKWKHVETNPHHIDWLMIDGNMPFENNAIHFSIVYFDF